MMINSRPISDAQHSAAMREETMKCLLQAQAAQVQAEARVQAVAAASAAGHEGILPMQQHSMLDLALARNGLNPYLSPFGAARPLTHDQLTLMNRQHQHQQMLQEYVGIPQVRAQQLSAAQHLPTLLHGMEKGIGQVLNVNAAAAEQHITPTIQPRVSETQEPLAEESSGREKEAAETVQNKEVAVVDDAVARTSASEGDKKPPSMAEAPNNANQSKGKDVILVPCRARGMPMDHNLKTAHFAVPEDIEHGAELICSYYACRNSGIKFRFCKFCQVPVAKRNFSKRHMHGQFEEKEEKVEDNCDDSAERNSTSKDVDCDELSKAESENAGNNARDSLEENDQKKEQLETCVVIKRKVNGSKRKLDEVSEGAHPSVSTTAKKAVVEKCDVSSSSTDDKDDAKPSGLWDKPKGKATEEEDERKQRWMSLFYERPPTEDYTATSNWLVQVLEVSDRSHKVQNEDNAEPSTHDSS